MKLLEELKKEYRELLKELGLENMEELEKMEYSSVALSRAKRKRGRKVYKWLILTGKVRENGKLKTKVIKNFYKDQDVSEPKLRKMVKVYRAVKALQDNE